MKATDILDAAAQHMRDRAATYDVPQGERSIARTVDVFNTFTGHDLTPSEGWLFLAFLKLVRNDARLEPHQDSLEDFVAYAALFAEQELGDQA